MDSNERIIVIGSTNTDMVVKTDRFPRPGETIMGESFFMNPGGKGANQAVAAARLGGNVVFVSSIGNDMFGEAAFQSLQKERVNVEHILHDPHYASGIAVVTVDKEGENSIVVTPGANNNLIPRHIESVSNLIAKGSLILMQLEIPLKTVQYVADQAIRKTAKLMLNPAPAFPLPDRILSKVYLITPNEEEATLLTGISVCDEVSARQAAKLLIDKGVKNVVITLGAKGSLALFEGEYIYMEAQKVRVVDTTAAGDVFNGALVVALNEEQPIREALSFANQAAALAVTRLGAQSSSPYRGEVENYSQTQNQI